MELEGNRPGRGRGGAQVGKSPSNHNRGVSLRWSLVQTLNYEGFTMAKIKIFCEKSFSAMKMSSFRLVTKSHILVISFMALHCISHQNIYYIYKYIILKILPKKKKTYI